LFKINSLINNTTSFTINRFAFELYDTRADGKLTVDEIHKMYEALPMSSKAFQECNVMVEMYIQSIFERVREKLNQIEFARFVEVIEVSCLGFEFIEMFRTPFEMCFERKPQAFQTTVLSSEETKKYYETKSSLLSIMG
jgi:Ca2+-binding EF-hand superfamily protein